MTTLADMAEDPQRLYRVAVLARLWGVTAQYVYNEIDAGRLLAVDLSNGDRRKLRVSESAAARWQEEHRYVSQAEREAL